MPRPEGDVADQGRPQPEQTVVSASQIDRIEHQLAELRAETELRTCSWSLLAVHLVLLSRLKYSFPPAAWLIWLALGGIGTVAVWFAGSARPLRERLTRVTIALVLGFLPLAYAGHFDGFWWKLFPREVSVNGVSPGDPAVFGFQLSGIPSPNRGSPSVFDNAFGVTVVCWTIGAFASAFLMTWFSRLQLVAPGKTVARNRNSIAGIFALTLVGALASVIIRAAGEFWQDRAIHFVNGMTLGFLATGMAWGVFQKSLIRSILLPASVIALVILLDLAAGPLFRTWGGSFPRRLLFVATFAGGLSVSPLLSFMLLRSFGFRLASVRIRTD